MFTPKSWVSIQSLLFSVYSTDIDAKNVEEMSNQSELEKIFLLTLVQNAKCYCITRQENPEFLGEFDGGAKTTSNSGVILFEYREIWNSIFEPGSHHFFILNQKNLAFGHYHKVEIRFLSLDLTTFSSKINRIWLFDTIIR